MSSDQYQPVEDDLDGDGFADQPAGPLSPAVLKSVIGYANLFIDFFSSPANGGASGPIDPAEFDLDGDGFPDVPVASVPRELVKGATFRDLPPGAFAGKQADYGGVAEIVIAPPPIVAIDII